VLDLIASYMLRGLSILFCYIPIRAVLAYGRFCGKIAYLLSGKRCCVTYSNLKAAFHGEKSPEEISEIAKKAYLSVGEVFAELVAVPRVDARYVEKYIKINNFERIQKAASNPKGMILVSAHFGNWELSTVASAIKGYPLYMLARDQKMKRLNELLNLLRETKGNMVVRKGVDIKNIFRLLRSGKSLGLLADQNAGASGELVDFFGRPASTATGPYRFAQKTGAVVLPAFIHRKNGPYQELYLEEIMEIKEDESIIPYMERYNALLEKHIRQSPSQWFWMHKRWKKTSVKKVMVLDDGKKGHLKESLAILKQIEIYRKDEGFQDKDLEVQIVSIRFRDKFRKAVFNAFCPLLTWRLGMHRKMLAWAMTAETYKDAINRYADVIVSCGSGLYGVSTALKIENYAKNIAVLDPGKINYGKFNVIVMPRHDVKSSKVADNIVVTELAPNLIVPSELLSLRVSLAGKMVSGKVNVGVLIGGDNGFYAFTEDMVRNIMGGIVDFCRKKDGKIFATTSRRTPESAENAAAEMLLKDSTCGFFVYGKNDTDDKTVDKILALSDIVVVSGESISMVSEAVSSGKPVVVFMPVKKHAKTNKYEAYVKRLENEGYLTLFSGGDLTVVLDRVSASDVKRKAIEDNRRIYEKIHKLF